MNPEQLESCTKKLPPDEALEFEWLHREASAMLAEAWRLRRLAWAIYRAHNKRHRR